MKAKLIFNLPEDNYDYKMATNGFKYSLVIQEIYQKFKSMEKHGDRENIPVSEAFEIVIGIMNDNAVYLDDLY